MLPQTSSDIHEDQRLMGMTLNRFQLGSRKEALMNSNHESPMDLRNCLDRRFQFDGERYVWRSTVGKFAVSVIPWRTSGDHDCIRVAVYDCLSDLEVEEWSHSVRCTENWRERLQELVGKAMIRAQHRPVCASCSSLGIERVPMLIKNSMKYKMQFFGCANYRATDCHYTTRVDRAFEAQTA